MVESKSIGDPGFTKEIRPTGKHAEISDTGKLMPECLPSPSDHQSPKSTSGNGHIVYFRRKAETELGKTSFCGNQSDAVDCPHGRKSNDQGETTRQNAEIKEPATCISNSISVQTVSASGLSAKHCVSPRGKSNNVSSPTNISYVGVNSANSLFPKKVNFKHWKERYCQLQNLLKMLDQSDQDDYVQILRSLSSVELSKHAVELEKRSILLSLEEAKEMQRVLLFDVLGKHPKNLRASSVE
ncbi:unnamed protein product [Fraxinus pennsylvanica]|uniref:Uncharacterized protein n=1 Tax=Fraxinus pennsylvanica TaxID=56036 RepID=A0AAD1YSZ6_9LAMI|nr:unnamed protein product [Fraxinus pennsylvanica]